MKEWEEMIRKRRAAKGATTKVTVPRNSATSNMGNSRTKPIYQINILND
jgi:hypothetical protein